MKNKTLTAVEWLITEIEDLLTIETFQKWKGIKEQALTLEREQIIDAYASGQTELFEVFYAEYKASGLDIDLDENLLQIENDKEDAGIYYTTKYGKQ